MLTRVLGIALPGHRDFEEVNLRFYVRRRSEDGEWRRAVVFVRELVPRRAIALAARWFYNEPYTAVPMRHELHLGDATDGQPKRAAGRPELPDPESEAAFITEHYWGYTVQRDSGTKEYRVEHPPCRVWVTSGARFDCDVTTVYGAGFAKCLGAFPVRRFSRKDRASPSIAGGASP